MKKIKESEKYVNALLKAIQILDCLKVHQTLSLKQLSELTHLNKSRILRFCGTLEGKRFLIRDTENSLYRLGPSLLALGKAYEQRNPFISLARPILRELSKKTGEAASLHIMDGYQRLCLAREEGSFGVQHLISEGERLPLYAGAGSKVLLAYAPEDLRREILRKEPPKRMTSTTITNLQILERECAKIRQKGYAISAGERDPDAGAMAAPVYDYQENICAAISIAGPLNRFSRQNRKKYLPLLLDAARCLSNSLGYQE